MCVCLFVCCVCVCLCVFVLFYVCAVFISFLFVKFWNGRLGCSMCLYTLQNLMPQWLCHFGSSLCRRVRSISYLTFFSAAAEHGAGTRHERRVCQALQVPATCSSSSCSSPCGCSGDVILLLRNAIPLFQLAARTQDLLYMDASTSHLLLFSPVLARKHMVPLLLRDHVFVAGRHCVAEVVA